MNSDDMCITTVVESTFLSSFLNLPAPKSGKVYFSQTSEIVFVEYRDLGSSSLRDGCVPIFGQPGIHAHHLHQSAIEIARLLYNLQKKGVLCLACNFLAVQDSSITDIVCPLVGRCEPTNNQSLGSIKE